MHLGQLPLEPGHIQLDPCTDQRGRLKCVPAESSAYAPLCWKEVGICRKSHQPDECGTRLFFKWVWVQGCSTDTLGGSKNPLGSIVISLKRGASGDKPSPSKEG